MTNLARIHIVHQFKDATSDLSNPWTSQNHSRRSHVKEVGRCIHFSVPYLENNVWCTFLRYSDVTAYYNIFRIVSHYTCVGGLQLEMCCVNESINFCRIAGSGFIHLMDGIQD